MSRAHPELYAVSERGLLGAPLADAAELAFASGLRWLQVREKDLGAGALHELVVGVVAAARRHGARVMVNDRADVALAAGADGVQLGEASMSVTTVRRAFPSLIVGASVHAPEAARAAAAAGADFVVFGPIFETPSKASFGAPQGLAALRQLSRGLQVPVVAIGGIGPEQVKACLEAGAAGVAAIRGWSGGAEIGAAVRAYLSGIDGRARGTG